MSTNARDDAHIDKGWYIQDLMPGTTFTDGIFVIRDVRFSDRTNGPKLTLLLRDTTGERKANCWQLTDPIRDALEASGESRLFRVSGSVDIKEGYQGEITITKLLPIAVQPQDLRPYLEPLPAGHKNTWKRFSELIRSVHNPYLTSLLQSVFDEPTRRAFLEAVAAQGHHHAYRGGLLEHTVEVAQLCQQACQVLPSLNHDLLVAGALLHDIGKLEEMTQGIAAGDFTDVGALHGHTYLGTRRIERAADQVDDFPVALRSSLLHLLLSHHGSRAYGAPVAPAFAEAVTLAQCDLISARVHACHAARATATPGQKTVRRSVGDADWVFVGDTGSGTDRSEEDGSSINTWSEEALAMPEDPPLPPASRPGIAMPLSPVGNAFGTAPANLSGSSVAYLPILGSAAAGDAAMSAEDGAEPELRAVILPAGGADYLVRVTGDSMIGAGILERDLLLIHRQETARDGDIVVAYVPGEGQVVKRLRNSASVPHSNVAEERRAQTMPRTIAATSAPPPIVAMVALCSENPAYPPIPLGPETRIQGRVVGLHREFQ